jgi:hypothetical protein
MLSVSTQHISKETADWLNEQGKINALAYEKEVQAEIHVGSHGYGWIVYCHDDGTDGYPKDLVEVLDFAVCRQQCNYVNLDSAGEEWDELKEYDW